MFFTFGCKDNILHFSFMVNYFELYGIPASFHPDAARVKAMFYELSRKYHPDRHTQADTATIADALNMAAQNNAAYKTLTNVDATMAYILKLNDLLMDEEKYNLPPDFLMEMMELNEAISDYETEPENLNAQQQATTALQAQLAEWGSNVAPLTTRYDGGEQTTALLLKIKDYYFRRKYLLRIKERINSFAAR
jgi:molecular chaperone HscB